MAEESPRPELATSVAELLAKVHPPLRPEHEQEISEVCQEVCELCGTVLKQLRPGFKGAPELRRLGSWKLGVAQPGSELDLILVAPEDVLPELADGIRKANASCPRTVATDGLLQAPGIQFKQGGTHVKLLFAASGAMPNSLQPAYAALYAEKVSDLILQRVPDVGRFQELLALVRHWAQLRGVVGSLFGFFSGTAWAICCARICQTFPNTPAAELLMNFFEVLCNWDWSEPIGLLVENVEPGKRQAADASSLVVKLPVGENLSATPNMCEFALRAVQKELKRAVKVLAEVDNGESDLNELFAQHNFFHRYRHYIQFDFLTQDEDIMEQWLNWGQVQLQELLQLCETMIDNKVTLRPWPCLIDFKDGDWPFARAIFIGIHRQRTEGEDAATSQVIDFREIMVKFLEKISSWPDAARYENQLELLIRPVSQVHLKEWLRHQQAGLVVPAPPREPEDESFLDGAEVIMA